MITIRGKQFTNSEIDLIKQIIAVNPGLSRCTLSILISQRLNWRQANGYLKDRACRDVLLRLAQKGLIELPRPVYTLISPVLNQTAVSVVMEAAAIAAYRKGEGHPVIDRLLCDDAPQFKLICRFLALCWVHEGRHYKKLCPALKYNAQKLTKFSTQFWAYYDKLLAFKNSPSPERADELSAECDRLFSTATGYNDLDQRILKTRAKKDELLLVLKYPEIPLHNNAAELAARVMARKRDVSLHTMTKEGTKANDTFLSIVETCKKLGINPFKFIIDRITKQYQIPSLADIIKSIAKNEHALAIY